MRQPLTVVAKVERAFDKTRKHSRLADAALSHWAVAVAVALCVVIDG